MRTGRIPAGKTEFFMLISKHVDTERKRTCFNVNNDSLSYQNQCNEHICALLYVSSSRIEDMDFEVLQLLGIEDVGFTEDQLLKRRKISNCSRSLTSSNARLTGKVHRLTARIKFRG